MSDPSHTADAAGAPVHTGRFSDAPIGAMRQPTGVRWLMILLVFMRVVAVLWIVKGLLHWAYIIGLGEAGFADMRLSRQGLLMLMAVFDLVAAVGMWMASSWGAALWIVVLFIEGGAPFWFPDLSFSVGDTILAAIAGVVYLTLVWQARREQLANQR